MLVWETYECQQVCFSQRVNGKSLIYPRSVMPCHGKRARLTHPISRVSAMLEICPSRLEMVSRRRCPDYSPKVGQSLLKCPTEFQLVRSHSSTALRIRFDRADFHIQWLA
jgi:hypothetical protein